MSLHLQQRLILVPLQQTLLCLVPHFW
jgi:hypothetical protein